ncbi:MAG: sxtJ [Gammaproteobacteria bacterium]|nr:sxtJ [Gammaproteobacteria bacterium]
MTENMLDKKGLRNFGLTTGGIIAVLFGLFFPWLLERAIPLWPWIACGILAAWALAAPGTLGSVYRGWMAVGHALGWINTRIILGFVFYLVVLPIGLLMRIAGKDPLSRKLDKNAESYRIQSTNQPKNHLERPF